MKYKQNSKSQFQLLAIKRLMDDPDYKDTVTKMAHNEIEVDMDAILVYNGCKSEVQYRDRIQELREALRDDGESDRDNDDEGDDWDQCGRYYSRNDDDDDSDHSHSSRKRHHEDDKSDRKHPRLNLDDALIMVRKQIMYHLQLASLQNKEESSQSSDTTGKKSDESNTESDTLEIPVAGKAATKVSLQSGS